MIFFSKPQVTIGAAQALHKPELFSPAAVFETDDGEYVMSLLQGNMKQWPPHKDLLHIQQLTGFKPVSICSPLLGVWKEYNQSEVLTDELR